MIFLIIIPAVSRANLLLKEKFQLLENYDRKMDNENCGSLNVTRGYYCCQLFRKKRKWR